MKYRIIIHILSERKAINRGIKQDVFLSPFLFNIYIKDFLEKCTELNVCARLGANNTSIVAYCDDIILVKHLEMLLKACAEYGNGYKIFFNADNSSSTIIRTKKDKSRWYLYMRLKNHKIPF
jgi:hypothetical protein